MHTLIHVLGLDSGSGHWYLFWSGFGSDLGEVALIGAIFRAVFNLRKQREVHHKQILEKMDN